MDRMTNRGIGMAVALIAPLVGCQQELVVQPGGPAEQSAEVWLSQDANADFTFDALERVAAVPDEEVGDEDSDVWAAVMVDMTTVALQRAEARWLAEGRPLDVTHPDFQAFMNQELPVAWNEYAACGMTPGETDAEIVQQVLDCVRPETALAPTAPEVALDLAVEQTTPPPPVGWRAFLFRWSGWATLGWGIGYVGAHVTHRDTLALQLIHEGMIEQANADKEEFRQTIRARIDDMRRRQEERRRNR